MELAESLGIYRRGSLCLSGEQLELLGSTPQQLSLSVNRTSVFYRVTPKHKVIIVKVIQIQCFVFILHCELGSSE